MKRRLKNRGRYLLLSITITMMISFTSIGYAYWSENVKISAAVSTGYVDVYFDESGKNPNITYYKDGSSSPGSNRANINFTMQQIGPIGEFKLKIKNGGTVPVRWQNATILNSLSSKGISTIVNSGYGSNYMPGEINSVTLKFIQDLKKPPEPGNYELAIILPYIQWTHEENAPVEDHLSWEKEVEVKVYIQVI